MYHSGGLFAYTTYLTLYPDFDLGTFISVNGPQGRNASNFIRLASLYVADLIFEAADPNSKNAG